MLYEVSQLNPFVLLFVILGVAGFVLYLYLHIARFAEKVPTISVTEPSDASDEELEHKRDEEKIYATWPEKVRRRFQKIEEEEHYQVVSLIYRPKFSHFLNIRPIGVSCSPGEPQLSDNTRYFYRPFYHCELERMKGVVYFGEQMQGPSKLLHGIDGVHGGASISFLGHLFELFQMKLSKASEQYPDGMVLRNIEVSYLRPIPLKTCQSFVVFVKKNERQSEEEEEVKLLGRIVDFENENIIFVEAVGSAFSKKGIDVIKMENCRKNKLEEEEEKGIHIGNYELVKDFNDLPSNALKMIEELDSSEDYTFIPMKVYEVEEPTVVKDLYAHRRYFILSPGFYHLAEYVNVDLSKYKYFFYRGYHSNPEKTTMDGGKECIIVVMFGEDTADGSGYVSCPAVTGILDATTALTNHMFIDRENYYSFTKQLSVEFSGKRIQRYEFVIMRLKYVFEGEVERGGRKRRYGRIEGDVVSLDDESVVYAKTNALFTSIHK